MEEVKPYEYNGSDPGDFSAFCYESSNDYGEDNKSPIKLNDNWLGELSSYFKLNTLLNCLREPHEKKHDISISNSVMNSIIDKKLGTITYHYNNKKSMKAYHTYDYPEVYYNRKLYNNCDEWIKHEFLKK
jgi:hypothetical protein